MRFTRYYSKLIKSQGLPNLNVEQHCRLMNIISLEGAYNQLEILRKNSGDPHHHEIPMYRIRQKLKSLTRNEYPIDVIKDMVRATNIDS